MKADLHVHSKYSHRPSAWILRKIGGAESYTEPTAVYRYLKEIGMDRVTLTDHDTIEGCLEIAHLADVFISEEVTTYFPEDRCKLHVLAYDITEVQHDEICRVRDNVFDLVAYLKQEQILHSVAHPMYAVNDRLEVAHFEKMLILFKHFELNGARDAVLNQIITRILAGLTKSRIEEFAGKHDLAPAVDRAWEKGLTSGSDDHSGLYTGTAYTEVPDAETLDAFIKGIKNRRSHLNAPGATPQSLAHNIYSIIYQFYKTHFQIQNRIPDKNVLHLYNNLLLPVFQKASGSEPAPEQSRAKSGTLDFSNPFSTFLPHQILKKSAALISDDPILAKCLKSRSDGAPQNDAAWFRYVQKTSDAIIRDFADEILFKLLEADIFYLLNTVSTTASLYAILSPFFIAYSIFSRDRQFSRRCFSAFGGDRGDLGPEAQKIALFTDTFNEINGVAAVVKTQVKAAQITGKPMTLIICDEPKDGPANGVAFNPIGQFQLPEYPEIKLFYPPVLEIIDYCYRAGFTHIHAETPGPVGLAALAAARTLNLPFHGTYHTSLPQTLRMVTGDSQIEELVWKYILWFYGQMERIYVPSAATAEELADKGIGRQKLIVHQWGVDTAFFHPARKNGFMDRQYDLTADEYKLLYVGRVSKEKNLELLAQIMGRIAEIRRDIRLIVVGDGPYLEEMKTRLADAPVIFTGYLTGDALAQVYASSDMFILPSTTDTLGNVVLEAQASGLPVLVTDQGGPKENLIQGETGYVLPANSAEGFVKHILYMADAPERLQQLQKNARQYMEGRSYENCFLRFWARD
ncbi:MAG TPA: glycosyltransferase [Desulfosalsimonadaceae bacterium]|nr:glycosyltransferase [Desulfosalsimonadaceae bacterium]